MRLGLAILLHLMLVRLQHAQDDCDAGSCHPAIGDLLLGRSKQLTASSTCGMNSPQKYCIIGYLEDEQKCFLCDSRYPYNPYTQHNSHMVENVITTFEPDRKKKWWQSENAMLVERSTDFGQTWKAFRYFAQDCTASFPNIPSGPAKSVGDIICDSRYSDIEPSTEGEVVLKALDPSFEIENPYVPHIQGCNCNGHSGRCHFDMAVYQTSGGVSGGVCEDCQDNTTGQHCDQCQRFFYRDPLKVISDPHACLPCNCDPEGTLHNGMCESRTDPALGTVAGRCPCKENVEGVRCDKCRANYYGLSGSDPLGCQPCNCDPAGSLPFSICDPATGECLCQRFATGQRCEKCLVGYWGLGNSLHGCSPCDCDIGGSQNNLCSPKDGQCKCLPNIVSRQCNEPAPGYFFLPLDYYIYEAEHAKPLSGSAPLVKPSTLPRCDIYFQKQGYEFMIENGKIVLNRSKKRSVRKSGMEQGAAQLGQDSAVSVVFRQPSTGRSVTWTGPGFSRVPSGAGLRFAINNIPFAMDFDITIRYEPESLEDWIASVAIQPAGISSSQHCKNKSLSQEPHLLPLSAAKRIALLQTPVCLEPGTEYSVDVYFSQPSASDPKVKSFILIDSLGLIPRISSVENLCSEKDLDEYQKYHCIEIASEVGPHVLPEACTRLIVSMSARIHNGAIACKCNPQGSLSASCSKLGGQCQCKANVVGRCCDTCSAGSYGFGFHGCYGDRCDECPSGFYKNPGSPGHGCVLCPCNNNIDVTDPESCNRVTGECTKCLHNTHGANCQFCKPGYFGSALNQDCQIKGGRRPSCDMRFKAFEDAISEIERILRHPVLSLETLSDIRDFQGYIQQKVAQMGPLHSPLYEFPDLNKNIEDIGEEADLVYELLQQKIHLHQSFHYLNLQEAMSNIRKHFEVSLLAEQKTSGTTPVVRYSEYTRNHALAMLGRQALKASHVLEQLRSIESPNIQNLNEKVKSIRKTAEESKLKGSQFKGQLERAKNQIEVDQEITKEFIRKVKDFLLDESAPPEDTEKVANYILQINLPLTSRELTVMLDKIRSIMKPCEKYKMNASKRKRKWEEAQTLLVEAQEADKAAKALLPVDEMNNKLKNVVKSQGRSKNTLIELHEEIRAIRTQISQAENKVNKTNDELNDLSAKQSEMEDEIATLQAKMLMNKNQAMKARAGAEAAHNQAQNIDNEFADIKRKYTILQEKLKARVPPKVTLEKVKQLKEAAEKLAEETERKIKRITDLEKKLRDLNQTKQDKAEQLRQLEEQEDKKCFICDSEDPFHDTLNPDSHRIENVVTTFDPNRLKLWWQSENGLENVTIQLNLEAEFHFTHLIMTFKTFRPAAMLIERSSDFGKTWQVYRYFAYDCESSFPGISTGPMKKVDDIICDSRYSDIEPSTEGEVIYRVLDPAFRIEDPYSPRIQNLLKITNLRVKFVKLHTLGDNLLDSRMEIREKYYYAIYDMVVRGNCFCYGHASECAPVDGFNEEVEGMVHGHCMCRHNTKGLNCEQCLDFYHDLPWRPAEGRNSNACKKCNCNGHSSQCHFDMAVYMTTGNTSGGVCDDCQHNTIGRNCEQCKPFYFQHPERDLRDPDVCEPCNCDPAGSQNGGICDRYTDFSTGLIAGQCRCKLFVEGERCDLCKEGFYGLSADDPAGCQSCACNPLGTHPGGNPCDSETGNCYCKRLVTGRQCDRCLPEHWGLSNDMDGCRPCDCDLGGALNNNCSSETGQCECRPHMFGRQCNQVEPGYYFISLDHYIYEAEEASLGPGVNIIERQYTPDRTPSWTGIGFVRVPEGAYLEFYINNIPYSMEYDILVRYEPQLPDQWEKAVISVSRPGKIPTGSRCGNTVPDDDNQVVSLSPGSRYVVLPRPVCFEKGLNYTIRLELPQYSSVDTETESPYTLIDSLVLMPYCKSLDIFTVGGSGEDVVTNSAWETFQRYRCLENSRSVVKTPMTDVCKNIIFSISALLHETALSCQCDPQGSLSSVCDPSGGQCQCRPNVVGRQCDRCAPGTFGFGPSGCRSCECHVRGSYNTFCDAETGQCHCFPGVYGRQCDRCLPGFWGFPSCQPCHCNGHADDCSPYTGECLSCRDHTAGHNCERCQAGYYGDPVLGSGDHCRPCPCPDGPESGRQFSSGCYQDPVTLQVVCVCSVGYIGSRCDECASGFFGSPDEVGGACQPCQCNNNIDTTDPEACDKKTGTCVKCLYHTEGENCHLCRQGYYGSALQQDCRKCVCNYLGTVREDCEDSENCQCEAATGQCRCLPNVVGQTCDRCAPNTWRLASGSGCEQCSCDPARSLGPACNEFTGQCQCMPGFGGRTCRECQELFWGDPSVECQACDCNPRGIQTPQCDRATGQCICNEGVEGPRCDKCSRGYSGFFPDCVPCHQCFALWDVIVSELANRTQQFLDRANALKVTGVTGPYQQTLSTLEEKLSEIKTIIAQNPAAEPLKNIGNLFEEAEKLTADVTVKIANIEENLSALAVKSNSTDTDLSALETDAKSLDRVVKELAEQLEFIKISDVRGALDSITKYFQMSLDAEERVNASTVYPDSAVELSAQTRQEVEDLISEREAHFKAKQEEQSRLLDELAGKLQSLDLSEVAEKTCGTPQGASCAESECGGLNCRTDDGKKKCGGPGCDGLVTVAHNAWQKAMDFDRDILSALAEVEQLSRMVSEAKQRADEAKQNAQEVLLKTNATKEQVDRSNEDLRALIKQIRDFLMQDSADLDSIEAVANEVLNMEMPSTPQQLQALTEDIRERVESLSDVEVILQQSAGDIARAEMLLEEAKKASKGATDVKVTADMVKAALEEAEKAQNAAEKAIKQADEDIKGTQDLLTSIESENAASEETLNNATLRLSELERSVEDLKQKAATNSENVDSIEETIATAKQNAEEVKKVLNSELNDKYKTVEDLIAKKTEESADARRKASMLQDEAKALLAQANSKLQLLKDLENTYENNQKVLEDKAKQLVELEETVRSLLQTISQKVAVYSTCL
ncbi:Lamb1 [Columba livia]|nr:Lamb1 [Columba livia]